MGEKGEKGKREKGKDCLRTLLKGMREYLMPKDIF
jgi:hypothetical protein